MYRLGAQGRAVQNKIVNQPVVTSVRTFTTPSDTLQDGVELVLSLLRRHGENDSKTLLSFVVHYLPKARKREDIRLIMFNFLQNPTLFPDNPDFSNTYMIIEAMKILCEKKIEISQPTVSAEIFHHDITDCVFKANVPPWKKVLVLTGMILSHEFSKIHITPETARFFNSNFASLVSLNHELISSVLSLSEVNHMEINNLMILSLSLSLFYFNETQKQNLPHDKICRLSTDLMFKTRYGLVGTTGSMADSKSPVMTHLNKLAYLIESSLVHGKVSFATIDYTLVTVLESTKDLYSRVTDNGEKSYHILKSIIFTAVIIFQGYISYSLQLSNRLANQQYPRCSFQILSTLFYLNFIIERMGSDGFGVYNFVYISAVDSIMQYSMVDAEKLGNSFLQTLKLYDQGPFEVSKQIFTLKYFETICQSCSLEYFDKTIKPFVDHIIKTTSHSRPLTEAAHSVILQTFVPRNSQIIASSALGYIHVVLDQFPTLLSPKQMRIAVETTSKAVAPPSPAYQLNKDNLNIILDLFHKASASAIPGVPVPPTNPNEMDSQAEPKTVRSSYIMALIYALPYCHPDDLESWLNKTWDVIQLSNEEEYDFCQNALLDLIRERLDMRNGNVAFAWWYKNIETSQIRSRI